VLPRCTSLHHPEPCALTDEVALELRYGGKHRQHESGHRIASRADVDTLGRRDEPDARRIEVADVREHVERGPTEAVELPDHDGIELAAPCRLHEALEAGPVVPRARASLLDVEDDLAPEPSSGSAKLVAGESDVLVEGRDAVVDGDARRLGSHRDGVRKGNPFHQPMSMGSEPRFAAVSRGRFRVPFPQGSRGTVRSRSTTRSRVCR
jgi:hypothetical protein